MSEDCHQLSAVWSKHILSKYQQRIFDAAITMPENHKVRLMFFRRVGYCMVAVSEFDPNQIKTFNGKEWVSLNTKKPGTAQVKRSGLSACCAECASDAKVIHASMRAVEQSQKS